MKLQLESKLGSGAFADVWKAKDELSRSVAVKIIRPSGVGYANALDHAKALARAHHPNVVSVLTIQKIIDPESGAEADCIVMEFIDGITLSKKILGPRLSIQEVKKFGVAIAHGIAHIHSQGMTHGDLHPDNVMITSDSAKVIDILYRDTLAILSTQSKEARLKHDLASLRFLIQQIIMHSELNASEATEFNNLLDSNATAMQIKDALLRVTDPANLSDITRILEHAFSRLTDDGFVEGEAYAAALIDETPKTITQPLLKLIVAERIYEKKYHSYLLALWGRLSVAQRSEFLSHFSTTLDKELPKGRWSPLLRMLIPLRQEGWNGLTKVLRMRLENLVVKDVLAGYCDIHRGTGALGGSLGTYAISLWPYFENPSALVENIASLLRQNWYTQNYVGRHFLRILPELAKATNKTDELVESLSKAVLNDAKVVVNGLEELPEDWVKKIRIQVPG